MRKGTFCLLFLFSVTILWAQNDAKKRLKNFNLEKGLAIQGYDPVAYFSDSKAVEGNPAISFEVKGVTYRFSTAKHKEIFMANPEMYEPQYGGWCAYAMGYSGEKVEVDPETFKILNGKLYLFYNAYFNNTLKKWNADEKKLQLKADANWKSFN
ncbi:MAG: YHS domain protein [Cyclobacteriaceae bacterium]|nr:YHS domain protein [Cyclobacteriaceae bacterium]